MPQRATISSSSGGAMPALGSAQEAQKAAFACGTEKRQRCIEPSAASTWMSEKRRRPSRCSSHILMSIASLPPEVISHHVERASLRLSSTSTTFGSTIAVFLNSAALLRRALGRMNCWIIESKQSGSGESALALKLSDFLASSIPACGLARANEMRMSMARNSCISRTLSVLPLFASSYCSCIVSKPYSFVGRSQSMTKSLNSSKSMSVAEPSSDPAAYAAKMDCSSLNWASSPSCTACSHSGKP
mmetsp:Transcript_32770/g.74069  ORF Transcript_32770/g.74069 Transcript_32770/m.74069 type:complete len:245 (-) Transcript_32770:599-1333(-)